MALHICTCIRYVCVCIYLYIYKLYYIIKKEEPVWVLPSSPSVRDNIVNEVFVCAHTELWCLKSPFSLHYYCYYYLLWSLWTLAVFFVYFLIIFCFIVSCALTEGKKKIRREMSLEDWVSKSLTLLVRRRTDASSSPPPQFSYILPAYLQLFTCQNFIFFSFLPFLFFIFNFWFLLFTSSACVCFFFPPSFFLTKKRSFVEVPQISMGPPPLLFLLRFILCVCLVMCYIMRWFGCACVLSFLT